MPVTRDNCVCCIVVVCYTFSCIFHVWAWQWNKTGRWLAMIVRSITSLQWPWNFYRTLMAGCRVWLCCNFSPVLPSSSVDMQLDALCCSVILLCHCLNTFNRQFLKKLELRNKSYYEDLPVVTVPLAAQVSDKGQGLLPEIIWLFVQV